jgi:regulator of sigma E protease
MLFENERGWQLALWFSVILNVNLAILNMLPIPVLDGGHIVLALVESVRRKPVNMRLLEIIQTGCAALIIGYIAYVSFFDLGDLLGSKQDKRVPRQTTPNSERR